MRHRSILAAVLAVPVLEAPVPAAATLPEPGVVYHYEVRGHSNASDLEDFAARAAETLADDRGWNLGGSIAFRRVPAGGDVTLWLAAAGEVPAFSSSCSAAWSCRVGRHVVINERNWLGATAAWNLAGAGLRDYQHMVINHEVGHWLGLGHPGCGGAGQPAPVMQQQSISLRGCVPNPWPLGWEREVVAGARGVGVNDGVAFGHVDAADPVPGGIHVGGWAIDPDTPVPTTVHVYVDGAFAAAAPAAGPRPDVAAAYPRFGADHGFDAVVPAAPGAHDVCLYAIDIAGGQHNPLLDCRGVTVG